MEGTEEQCVEKPSLVNSPEMSGALSGVDDSVHASGPRAENRIRTRKQPRKDYAAMMNSPFDDSNDEECDEPDYGEPDDPSADDTSAGSCSGVGPARPAKAVASIFTCVVCFASADDRRSHLEHLASSHPNLKTHCLACESQYDTYSDYAQHLRDSHPQVLQAIDEAGSGAAENALYCLECGKAFDKESYLYQHRSQHFMLNRVPCEVCGKSFLEGAMMERHLETHKVPKFDCPTCRRTFRSAVSLRRHEKAHKRFKHRCQVCGVLLSTALSLEIHKCTRHNSSENQFLCSFCQKECDRPDKLRKHMTAKHGGETGGERLFPCPICGRQFRWKHSLKDHVALHEAEKGSPAGKVVRCRHCDQPYASQCALKAHMITHSNQRQFPCNRCGVAFKRKHALTEHCQAVHCTEKSFQCSTCGQTFAVKRYLDAHCKLAHAQSSTPYTCSECQKEFRTQKSLGSHFRTCHTDVPKTFICDFCHKKFPLYRDLRRHKLTHGGDRSHKCENCGSAFYRADNLQRHLKTACKFRDL